MISPFKSLSNLFFPTLLLITVALTSCSKNQEADSYNIQQGADTVQIGYVAGTHGLTLRMNQVVNATVDLKIQVTSKDSSKHTLSIEIPANYNGWVSYLGEHYIVEWNYDAGYKDSVTNTITNPNYSTILSDYAYLRILGISSSDKSYGFQEIRYDEDWHYTDPLMPASIISFTANGKAQTFKKYFFEKKYFLYNVGGPGIFGLTWDKLALFTNQINYDDFKVNKTVPIPYFNYSEQNIYYGNGTPSDNHLGLSKSTIELSVTSISDGAFDGIFSGKTWIAGTNGDTLIIENGTISNLPFSIYGK
ncbi:hypothetical protein [Rhizosphaericola mali]|uniref:Uncharacterized protein n=1 Tax=Rhizosphaericola mali TaxID=2545455 RepID=A0A5P2G7B0_9BACT|nr:hypothetical protein [Rhizosphaericola mali]QES89650.1 hypothetical protein E0W69_013605 [Rhizosphaericola mali]